MEVKDIKKALINSNKTAIKGNPLRRLNTLSTMIYSILRNGKSRLTKLASSIKMNLDFESRVKKLKRWVCNKYVNHQSFFLPFLGRIMSSIQNQKKIILVIDGSPVGNGCICLMVSIVWRKRAIPLCWLVRRGKKGHFPAQMHTDLVKQIGEMLPKDCEITLLGDGEFSNVELIRFCEESNWFYIFRVAKSRIVEHLETHESGKIKDFLYPSIGRTTAWIPDIYYTKKKFFARALVCHHNPKHEQPWYLISNIDYPPLVIKLYEKRFAIETLFSDLKSRGFNIHKSMLRHPERLNRLLIAVCLAYIFTIFIGLKAVKLPDSILKKIIRHDKMEDYSIFFLGLNAITFIYNASNSKSFFVKELRRCCKSVRL